MFGAPQFSGAINVPIKPVGIFWDIDNCPIPKGKSASSVIHYIRNFFIVNRLNNREYEFLVACDVTRIRKDIPDDINRAGGVTLAHVSSNSKNAADEKLRESMKRFMDTHGNGASGNMSPTLILISGDIDFVNDLRAYQVRNGSTVILIYGTSTSCKFREGWNEMYAFQDFCAAIPAAPSTEAAQAGPGPSGQNKGKTGPKPPRQGENSKGGGQQAGKPDGQVTRNKSKHPSGENSNFPKEKFQGPENGLKNKKYQGQNGPFNQGGSGNPNPAGYMQNQSKNKPPQFGNQQNGVRVDNAPKPKKHGGLPQNAGGGPPFFNGQARPNAGQSPPEKFGAAPREEAKAQDKPKEEHILMVSGLPGKMDFQILKNYLQKYASQVNGKVKYVNNGQAFICFRKVEDLDKAIQLFQGTEVYGKKLVLQMTRKIPFPPAPGAPGFVMVQNNQAAAVQEPNNFTKALGDVLTEIGSNLNKSGSGSKAKGARKNSDEEDKNCCIQ